MPLPEKEDLNSNVQLSAVKEAEKLVLTALGVKREVNGIISQCDAGAVRVWDTLVARYQAIQGGRNALVSFQSVSGIGGGLEFVAPNKVPAGEGDARLAEAISILDGLLQFLRDSSVSLENSRGFIGLIGYDQNGITQQDEITAAGPINALRTACQTYTNLF